MKNVYVLRNVGSGPNHGVYSSKAKAEAAARRLFKLWNVKSYEYSPHTSLTFFWINDDDHDRNGEGVVIDKCGLQ